MLEVKNLSKQFNSLQAVKDVSFKVKPGEIFALIGPNGSGKTTIIKTIAGLLKPSAGGILVDGHDVVAEPVKAKRIVGYIPDEPTVWPHFSGEEFLHFSGALYGVKEQERTKQIPKFLDIFDLAGLKEGAFEDYSRGNKQKFAILAALLHSPQLLLIDEPIVGLDPTSAEIAKRKFREFAQAGGAVLMVTHTLPVAEEIAGTIGVLDAGVLTAVGSFSDLKQKAGLDDKANLEDVYQALT
jgi:ABC-2 type transport system ATP-binding protein